MKYLIVLLVLSGCSSVKLKHSRVYLTDLVDHNQVYRVQNNPYFYFMIDSLGNKHLVRMNMLNAQKVLWTEKLSRVK